MSEQETYAFTGWIRLPGQDWQEYCFGRTEAAALADVREHAKDHPHSEILVNDGRHPDERKKPR